jgi:hypothetical protein
METDTTLNKMLSLKSFEVKDSIILICFSIVVILRLLSNYTHISVFETEASKGFYEILINFILVYIFCFDAMSISFRIPQFTVLWVILCLIYVIADKHIIVLTPLVILLMYYLLRFIFKRKYDREFIACYLLKGGSKPYFSKIDNRESTAQDAVFTWIFFFLNFFGALAFTQF